MSLSPGEIFAYVLPIFALFLCGFLWFWRRPGQVKRLVERLVGAKKQKDIHWGYWLSPRSALVEDEEERRVSSTSSLTRGQPSQNEDVHWYQVHPSPPPSTYRPRPVERDCITLKQLPTTLYLRIIVFTSSPQTIRFPDLPDTSAVQVPEVPGVVFSLYINPNLREVQIEGLKDIDWERCARGSIREFRIMENGRVAQDNADGIIDATRDCKKGNALARPLHVMPETSCIQSGLEALAKKIMEQEGTVW